MTGKEKQKVSTNATIKTLHTWLYLLKLTRMTTTTKLGSYFVNRKQQT